MTRSLNEIYIITAEECAEVIQCITKLLRNGEFTAPTRRHLNQEIGDVEIMIEILGEYKQIDRAFINQYKAQKRNVRG